MKKKIAVIAGDGIGPEVTSQAERVLNAIASKFKHKFVFERCLMGACAIDKTGTPLPDETIRICKESDAVLLGAIGHPKYDFDPSAKIRPEQGLLKLRQSLQLFANIRPVVTYPCLYHLSPLKNDRLEKVDFIIFRELTGGVYFGKKEMNLAQNTAFDSCTYTKEEIIRIAHLAFRQAQKRRKKLTLVDKANVLETSRLWRLAVQELALQYIDVQVDYMYVDNAAMQIIMNPAQFDIILTENMFGDILSDEASVLSGSLGLLPSASIGTGVALFEPIHGSYPQAAGKNIANPLGSILSAAMMLDYFSLREEAEAVRTAAEWTLANNFVTSDLNTSDHSSTSCVGTLICDFISNNNSADINRHNVAIGKSTIV